MKAVGKFLAAGVVIFFLAAISPSLIVVPFEFAWTLCLGWAFAAVRLATRLQEHTTGLLTWGVSFLVVGFLAHRFCKAIAASRNVHWPTRWTIAGFGGLTLSLMAAMAVIGVVHQIGWIAVSREPWTHANENQRLLLAAALISNAAQNGGWTAEEIRRVAPIDGVDVVLQRDSTNNKITNVVVIQRDGHTGFIEVRRDGRSTRRPMSELNHVLGIAAAK